MAGEKSTVRREDVLRILAEHRAELTALHVDSLALFGSVARDEAGPESDIDLMVEFAGDPTFDRYMDLKRLLENVLQRRVDLVIREDLKPRLRARVERDAVRVA